MVSRLLCGLISGGLMATILHSPQAKALSEEELLSKFSEVSVFVLSNGAGGYITTQADFPNDDLGRIDLLQVFFDEADARKVGEQLRQVSSEFRENGEVGVTNLATVHLSAAEAREIPLRVVFVPRSEDLEAAQALDPTFGTGATNASSLVPLFGIQNADGDFMSLPFGESGEPVIGMFFANSDAEAVLNAVNAQKPEWQAQLGVVSLGSFSSQMLSSNDETFEKVRFLQSQEVVNSNQRLLE